MEALDRMLQERFAQLESRLVQQIGTMCLPLPPPPNTDLIENLIQIEEKVTSFHNMFDQLATLTKTTDAILSQVKTSSEIKAEPRTLSSPAKSGGISINLLPLKTTQAILKDSSATPTSGSMSDLCKTTVDILGLVRAIDVKVASNVNKVSIIDAKISSLQSRVKADGVDPSELVSFKANNENGDVSSVKESQSDMRQLIEEKLVPVQAISDKLDMLIKQVILSRNHFNFYLKKCKTKKMRIQIQYIDGSCAVRSRIVYS